MQNNVMLGFFQLQSDGSWGEDAATVSVDKDGEVTSDPIHLDNSGGIVTIQVSHTGTGSPTITGEIFESVDGVTYVLNATGFGDAIAKDTPTIHTHDAKANRRIKIFFAEDDVIATVVTLSVSVR